MPDFVARDPELQVKSTERVRDLGEVFTPADTVQAMLDLLPDDVWQIHPARTFLEPACGDGNFLVAVLDRKLEAISKARSGDDLAAAPTEDGVAFHALEALASIYAVDISADNVIGGTPGHEVGARDRLLAHLKHWYERETGTKLTVRSRLVSAATWIVERNVLVANMLATNADGSPSRYERLPLVEYEWDPASLTVSLSTTTLGDVMDAAAAENATEMSLFSAPEPTWVWSGEALRLHAAPVAAPKPKVKHARNANRES